MFEMLTCTHTHTHTHIWTTQAYVYYKLTNEPKGSGELIMILERFSIRIFGVMASFIESCVQRVSYSYLIMGVARRLLRLSSLTTDRSQLLHILIVPELSPPAMIFIDRPSGALE